VDARHKAGHDVLGLQNAKYYNRIRSRAALPQGEKEKG
jgi:hypothetical protein